MTKDFLTLFDVTREELESLFTLTDRLKREPKARPLQGKSVAMIFQKPSLRTRVSFEVGIVQLGGHPVVLSQEGIGIGTRESAPDVARLLSRYCDGIVARMFDHAVLTRLASFASVPVVNALTDVSHPCQVLADLYTLRQHKKLKPGIKVAFIGDGNNMVHSWMEAASIYPIEFVLAAPDGYHPDPAIMAKAKNAGISTLAIVKDPSEAAAGADVLYTDVWTSMGKETEADRRRSDFAGYQIDATLLRKAKSDCVVLHCLPAHRGEEITSEVLEGPQSIVFDEAENRLHVQKAILVQLLGGMASPQDHKAVRTAAAKVQS
jgi:ornithine carbamoyltransferase